MRKGECGVCGWERSVYVGEGRGSDVCGRRVCGEGRMWKCKDVCGRKVCGEGRVQGEGEGAHVCV